MKKIFCNMLVMLVLFVSSCGFGNKSKNTDPYDAFGIEIDTTVKFASTEYDFGTVREGEQVVSYFEVENTGKVNLIIHDVRVSCGCTAPKFDQQPIRPGQKSVIEVNFDTRGRPGNHRRGVILVANTEPSNIQLIFSGEVIPADY